MLDDILQKQIEKHGQIVAITFSLFSDGIFVWVEYENNTQKLLKLTDRWKEFDGASLTEKERTYRWMIEDCKNKLGMVDAPSNAMIDYILDYLREKENERRTSKVTE